MNAEYPLDAPGFQGDSETSRDERDAGTPSASREYEGGRAAPYGAVASASRERLAALGGVGTGAAA